jgi:archaellum component FlaC
MMKKNRVLKSLPRLAPVLALVLIASLLLSGCDDKLGKLKGKWEVIEKLLASAQAESDKLQEKIDKLRAWEKEDPRPAAAIDKLMAEISSEQSLLNGKREQALKQLPELTEEIEDLSTTELAEVVEYISKWIPFIEKWLGVKVDNLKSSGDQVSQNTATKLDNLLGIVDQEVVTIGQLQLLPPGPERDSLLMELAGLIADASAISLHEEQQLASAMAEQFKHIGPLPVVAGTVIEHISFIIEEGLPPGLEHLDNGVLEVGSEIILQLPEGWQLTAPAEMLSDNLVFDISGNEPGSGLIKAHVLSENTPGTPDDKITVAFNGILVSEQTGLATGLLTVLPGRTSKQDFCVIPRQQVTALSKTDSTISLDWDPFGTFLYTVQWAGDLAAGTWENVPGSWPITETSWTGNDVAGLGQRYYRVVFE